VDQRELVERARKGDHDAFATLARAALARLDAVARLILRDAELARDAVQEAMVLAWRDLPRVRDPERFGGTSRVCAWSQPQPTGVTPSCSRATRSCQPPRPGPRTVPDSVSSWPSRVEVSAADHGCLRARRAQGHRSRRRGAGSDAATPL